MVSGRADRWPKNKIRNIAFAPLILKQKVMTSFHGLGDGMTNHVYFKFIFRNIHSFSLFYEANIRINMHIA